MEDDHVDRPGVEVRQRMKLTGTNSSIGLIVLIPNVHRKRDKHRQDQRNRLESQQIQTLLATPYLLFAHKSFSNKHAFCRPGGYGGAAAPDPIPNSAVKRSSADGTSSQDAGE